MKYTVVSGEFNTLIESDTPKGAAEQALSLWRLKNNRPSLSKILMVVKPDNKEVYLRTEDVLATSA